MANISLTSELSDKYNLVGDTLIQKSLVDPINDVALEIGDSKQVDFYPQVKLSKWQNEVNFSARFVDTELTTGTLSFEKNVIKYLQTSYEVHLYDLGFDEKGGFEIEALLKSKPKSNILTWSLQYKNLEFYYQPPLTAEEIKEGAERPENIIGSYAVYHSTKRNNRIGGKNYRHGKAFHIYRPKATDALDNWTWCDLNITGGTMTVTIPQSFLDTATYPILVDPTLGYTTTPGSTGYAGADKAYGSTDSATEDGTVTSMSFYTANASYAPNIKGLLIEGTGDTIVTNGITNAHALTASVGWDSATFSTNPTISNGTTYYMLGIVDATWGYGYDSGVGWRDETNSYSSPIDPTDITTSTRIYGVYATYTASGGGGGGTTVIKLAGEGGLAGYGGLVGNGGLAG